MENTLVLHLLLLIYYFIIHSITQLLKCTDYFKYLTSCVIGSKHAIMYLEVCCRIRGNLQENFKIKFNILHSEELLVNEIIN